MGRFQDDARDDSVQARAAVPVPGWAEYGDPGGVPLLYHHGMPGAHPEAALLDRQARLHGFRIIVPDRPGIGKTPLRPLQAVVDLAAPCCALLDRLGIAACHQVGWSSGGPVALAMAASAPERVRGITLMASYTHFYEVPGLGALLAQGDDAAGLIANKMSGSLVWLVNAMHWTERLTPTLYQKFLWGLCGGADRELLDKPLVREKVMAAQDMAFCQGPDGAHQDLLLQHRDWGFRLSEIDTPILLFQGQDDPFVMPQNAEDLEARLPRCELRRLDEKGHLFPLSPKFQGQWLGELHQRLEHL